jgi:hypothetical protein
MPNLALLDVALKMYGNRLVPMLHKLMVDRKVSCHNGAGYVDYTIQQFVHDWTNGGKQFCENKWRTDAFSPTKPQVAGERDFYAQFDDDEDTEVELFHGQHEWIPTNMLGYVVEHALLTHGDARWLVLADALRTPTTIIVVHPGVAHYASSAADPFGMTGHVEAVFLKGPSRFVGRTKGQSTFHDGLRSILRTHLTAQVSDPHGFVAALKTYIGATFWLGDIISAAAAVRMDPQKFAMTACPYYYKVSSGVCGPWGSTMGDMAIRLQQEWAVQEQIIANIGRAIQHC